MNAHRKLALAVLMISGAVAGGVVAGCSVDQIGRAAEDVRYAAGGEAPAGEATTRPSAGRAALETARVVVRGVSATSPAVGEVAGLVALLSGAVAGVAGHLNGKRSGRRQAHAVIAEIVDDVAAFRRPGEPWTARTRKLLEDLGYADEARATGPAPA